eukprot:3227717-Pyramimonas_sp.AAC.1
MDALGSQGHSLAAQCSSEKTVRGLAPFERRRLDGGAGLRRIVTFRTIICQDDGLRNMVFALLRHAAVGGEIHIAANL